MARKTEHKELTQEQVVKLLSELEKVELRRRSVRVKLINDIRHHLKAAGMHADSADSVIKQFPQFTGLNMHAKSGIQKLFSGYASEMTDKALYELARAFYKMPLRNEDIASTLKLTESKPETTRQRMMKLLHSDPYAFLAECHKRSDGSGE